MRLNTDAPAGPRKPCLRDMATLVNEHLPPAVVQLTPLKQLKRRLREIDATHPQYQEETPLVLAYEQRRRAQLGGQLQVVTSQRASQA
ncbi:hypothetical protein [Hymenobacter metallicola]|uniref:Uncharacterized protein n=1 Tax=Hymenobacter metallicola TaxID=2563114 RepID=A0A4Z0QB62_9BACT|nr:hypothetical protein [Hymenobacter metallicola]TGE26914.1 hypothetical protein E5K02_10935 [Hymenobacter metallicola]